METTKVAISDLKFADYNPRHISQEVLDRLKAGLEEFGLVQPVVVNKNNGVIIGGHQRVTAAQELGWTEIDVVYVDADEKREKALNLALNKLSGEWDFGKLSSLLTEFESDLDFNLELTGFDPLELMEMSGADSSLDLGDLDDFDMPGSDTGVDDGETDKPKGYSIQYTIVFNDEEEQNRWHEYLKYLKSMFPDLDTISERLIADLDTKPATE